MAALDSKLKLGGASAGLVAVGLALGVAVAPGGNSDNAQKKRVADASTTLAAQPDDFDPRAYSAAVTPVLDADAQLADLLSVPVAVGASVDVGANLPRGARFESVDVTGKARGLFVVAPTFKCRDEATRTWCEVHATNASTTPLRFTAFVRWGTP